MGSVDADRLLMVSLWSGHLFESEKQVCPGSGSRRI
jgi:hypothetical protein